MENNGSKYEFVVTSANDRDCLTLECTDSHSLILEAILSDYKAVNISIVQHVESVPFKLMEEFLDRIKAELSS